MSQGWNQSFSSSGNFASDQNSALSYNKEDSKIPSRDSCMGGTGTGAQSSSTQSFSSWSWSTNSSNVVQPNNASSSNSHGSAVAGMGTWRADGTKEETKSQGINWDHIVEDEFRKEIGKMAVEVAEEQNRM